MRGAVVLRALPFFRGSLAFGAACGGDAPAGDDGTDTGSTTAVDSGSTLTASSTDADDATSTTDDPIGTCDAEETCIAAAPAGWIGPFVHAPIPDGRDALPCPEAVPEAGPVLHAGFHPPASTMCECACEPHEASECYALLYTHDTLACSDFGYDNVSPTESCTNFGLDGFFEIYSFGYGSDGACDPIATIEIPPTGFDARIQACVVSPDATRCADDRLCAPAAPDGFERTWCIAREGEHDCPDGDPSVREIVWTDLEDTRACTSCTCGFIGTSCAEIVVDIYGGPDCGGVPVQSTAANAGCTYGLGQSLAIRSGPAVPCPVAEPSVPTGAAAPVGPITICCAPER